ncbi:cathepsin L, putative [Perkinsus marinus ATCC 50983]|uniref:Cathepsin L, putative n=1 Tax=Perkinsus marinus (strain ATCC 50983 / TXsc) TaxID=423536 RepID=C5LS55_PERM5|nr:cathepsin L, putative [Perkinsus marinus ATCC 50983]EER00417.1 cathepsin L, putative [Perkinsus marinus ATCC 50983]|eukprot:XP_002767699.1 cathepsin L, putative [Perkinsus marinus ATCC 50983]
MSGIQIDGWVQLPGGADEETIKRALVNNGLLAVSFLVTDQTTFYRGGVINDPACKAVRETDHAVNLVGYGTDPSSGLDYWLLRNSWSTNWGDEGYFKIVRGERDCGISGDVSYPIIRRAAGNSSTSFYQPHESAHMVYRGPEISSVQTLKDAESSDEAVVMTV